MIQVDPPNTLWYPGKKIEGAPLTARAREIAKSREELLGLLHGLPESEYELSFTDLVERSQPDQTGTDDSFTDDALPEREVNQAQGVIKERKKARKSSSSFDRSCSSGVLLNMYFPSSLTRSLTSSSARHGITGPKLATKITHRDREGPKKMVFGCWSAIWHRRSEKSREKDKRKNEMRDHKCSGFY